MKTFQRSFQMVSVAFLLVAVVALLASPAFAQTDFLIGPGGPLPAPAGTTGSSDIKTPPLTDGEAVSIPISVHNPGPGALPNWAGVQVEVHLVDASEVDITGVDVGGVPVALNPFLSGANSNVAVFTWFHPAAFASGISLQPSSSFPAITLHLAAKNTDPINNSDVDIKLRFADIYHRPGATLTWQITNTGPPIHRVAFAGSTMVLTKFFPGSTYFPIANSHKILVQSDINSMEDLHLTAGGHQANSNNPFPNAGPNNNFASKYVLPGNANPETGHFHHLPAGVAHVVSTLVSAHRLPNPASSTMIPTGGVISTLTAFFPGSTIFAMPFLATANIGIEHVPEPAAPILLLVGIASLAFGFRSRRRRRQDK